LLNPAILEHIQLARQHWYDSDLMLVTNGFFLHRFPELPRVLVNKECQLEISQHGTHQDYLDRFREIKAIVWSWRKQYPKLRINIRKASKSRRLQTSPMPSCEPSRRSFTTTMDTRRPS
jgi:hypothetical protein